MRPLAPILLVALAFIGASPGPLSFDRVAADNLAAARKELRDAAAAHRVKVSLDQLTFVNTERFASLSAPIEGIERYSDADFAKGVPLHLLIVRSPTKGKLANGSYVARVQYQPGQRSGKTTFVDRAGKVAAQTELFIRSREQELAMFPGTFPPGTDIPVITSTHLWVQDKNGSWHWAVDCAGWNPPRVLIFFTT